MWNWSIWALFSLQALAFELQSLPSLQEQSTDWTLRKKKNKELLYKEIDSKNYIQSNCIEGGKHIIRITPDGKAFLQSSSFEREHRSNKRLQTRTTRQQSILTIANIFSIISVISAIILGFLSYKQNETIKDLNSEIKTLKQENTRLQDSLSLRPNFKTTDNKTK